MATSTLQRAARGSVLNVAGAGVTAVVNFGLALVVTQLTEQSDAGLYFAATSLFLLAASVGQLGTNTGLVYFISGARSTGRPGEINAYMRAAVGPVLVASVAIGVVLFIVADPLSRVLSEGRESEFAQFVRVSAIFLPCASVLNLALSGTRGLGTMTANSGLDQVARPILQFIATLVFLLALGAGPAAIGWAGAYLPLAIIGWWWWATLRDASAEPTEPAGPVGPAFWRFTSPRALATVAQVAMQRLDIVLVGALAGLEEAAVYTAATRFLVLGQSVARAVSTSVQPLLGESLGSGDRDEAEHLYQSSTAWLILLTWPLYLTLIGFGGVVLGAFGDGYAEDGAVALTILCVAMLIATACGMVDMVLTMAGRSFWNLMNVLFAFAVYVVADLALIPDYGLVGAAIGWGLGILAANLVPLAQVWKSIGVHPYGRGTMTAMVLGLVAFGIGPLVAEVVASRSLAALIVSLVFSAAVYGVGVYRFRSTLQLGVLVRALRRGGRGRKSVNPSAPAESSSPGGT